MNEGELWQRRSGGNWVSVKSGDEYRLSELVRKSVRTGRFDGCALRRPMEFVVLPVGRRPAPNTEPLVVFDPSVQSNE